MTHPAHDAVEAARKKQRHPGGTVEGSESRAKRLDRKWRNNTSGAVDASSWRPPVAHDIQPLNQEVIDTSLDVKRGISDKRGDIPERKKYAAGGAVRRVSGGATLQADRNRQEQDYERNAPWGQRLMYSRPATTSGDPSMEIKPRHTGDDMVLMPDKLGTPPPPGPQMRGGGGIHIKKSHEGLLHKNLGVPAGEKIPAAKMERAKASASPAEKKRIVFAENAKKWHHGG